MRVLLLATDIETRNYYITLAALDALKRNVNVEAAILATHADALALQARHRCDCFLAIGSAIHQPALLARLCAGARVSLLWTSEDPYDLEHNVQHSKPFDHVFTNDSSSVDAYGGRATAMPYAASLLFHDLDVRASDADYRYDLLFIGTAWPNRVKLLRSVLASFKGELRTKIALPSNEFLPPPVLRHSDQNIDWRCSNVDFARLSNASRVTLTLERDFTATPGGRSMAETPPPRLFESALAGGYQVVLSHGNAPAAFFTPQEEIALCADVPAVVRSIRDALEDPATRIRRATAARRRARQQHLYDHRLGDMIDWARAFRGRPSPAPAVAPKRRVLLVTHNLDGMRPGGGVEAYQEELPRMAGGFEFLYLVPTLHNGTDVYRLRRADGSCLDYVLPGALHPHALHDAGHEAVFQRILIENAIDLVHFQHLIGHPLSLPLISFALGVPSIWTIHDYFLVCKRFNLIDYSGRFCDIANRSKVNCDICLNATDNLPANSQGRRWSFVSHIVRHIDRFVANTRYSGDYLRRVYPEIPEGKVTHLEMLMPGPSVSGPSVSGTGAQPPSSAPATGPLRVVIPGNFTEGKGAHQLIRMMNLMRGHDVEFTILGYISPEFETILGALQIGNLKVAGKYRHAEAVALLSRHDVSLHLSIWPETYMITLSESWAAGLVPIVSSLGAPGERVTDAVDGYVVDPYEIGAMVELIQGLAADRTKLRRVQQAVAAKEVMSPARHLQLLRTVYEAAIQARPVRHAPEAARSKDRQALSTAALGLRTNSAFWDRPDNVWDQHAPVRDAAAMAFMDALPDRYAAARQIVADLSSPAEFKFTLDGCTADGEPAQGATLPACRRVQFRGWAFATGQGALDVSFVRLLGQDGTTRVIELEHRSRADVGTALNDPSANACGFDTSLDLLSFGEDEFQMDLVQVYAAAVVTFPGFICSEVRPSQLERRRGTVPARAARSAPRPPGPAAAAALGLNLR